MKPKFFLICGIILAFVNRPLIAREYDLVIYGGTCAAITAAVQAKKMGKSVLIVSPDKHLGGLSSGGLGWTDTGNKSVIGGLSREFYHRIWKHYEKETSWRQQKKEEYGNQGQGTPAVDGAERTMWIFEPHAAEQVFEDLIVDHHIEVIRDSWLDRNPGGVTLENGRITQIKMLDGKIHQGKMFLDTTYEGDLLAAAGVAFHVGRESKANYGEEWNGIQTGILHHRHHFDAIPGKLRIDPFVVKGDSASGVLPKINPLPPGERHSGDDRVQAYCFRMCLTNDPANRVPFPKPDGYDPKNYELLARIFEAGWNEVFGKFDPIPNHKTDTNNHGPMSTDNIGMNYRYPEGTYDERKAIIKEHENYQKGWLYFIANDPRVPKKIQEEMNTWGLPKDEFIDNGNWSHQLYIREARRMIGKYVMTENDLLEKIETPQSVGMGSYTIDSHNVQRYITPEGYVQNEGDIGVKCSPYEISYGSLVPKKSECENLLVPVCVSSSHIAFGSIRMEPVFMILGQSAATAAVQAIDDGVAVQDIDYEKLRKRLLADGQVLEYMPTHAGNGIDPGKLPGILMDDTRAEYQGHWQTSTSHPKFLGMGYHHDGGGQDGKSIVIFKAKLPKRGWYEIRLAYTPDKNRSSKVPVLVNHIGGQSEVILNEKETPEIDEMFAFLGSFEFTEDSSLSVSNKGADGHVVVDGVQWLPVDH